MSAATQQPIEEIVVGHSWLESLPWLLLALLVVLLILPVLRRNNVTQALRDRSRRMLLLAGLAGWMSAWVYVATDDWFGVPSMTGLFIPGAIFAALVLVPLVVNPRAHPFRVLVLIAAGATAHYAMWFVGVYLFDSLLNVPESAIQWIVMSGIPGSPAVIAFSLVVSLAIWRAGPVRLTSRFCLAVIPVSWLCGWLYQLAVLDLWEEWLDVESPSRDIDVYLAYILWYGASAATLRLVKPAGIRAVNKADLIVLAMSFMCVIVSWPIWKSM